MNGQAKALYEQLISSRATELEKRKLSGLWSALNQMKDEGISDYSIVNVGRFSDRHSGPKTQSVRNKSGRHYRDLIVAFVSEAGYSVAPKKPSTPPIEEAIASIPDKGSQLVLRMALVDYNLLKTENDKLRAAFKMLSIDPTADLHVTTGPTASTTWSHLTTLHLYALERIVSNAWVEERAWRIEADGSIMDEASGMLVAPPGFCDAIKIVLEPTAS